jgi:hypothetical protein
MEGLEEKVCNECGQSRSITKFRLCCDSYTGEKKWRRNICNWCEYQRRLQKGLRQFTPATAHHKL